MADHANDPLTANSLIEILRMAEENKQEEHNSEKARITMSAVQWVLGIFQIFLLILFVTCTGNVASSHTNSGLPGTVTQGYNMFIGVEIMMFVGFGYLMTYAKWYGLGAVGFTMMITALALQWAVFTNAFWYQLYHNDFHDVSFNIYSLLDSLYAVSCVLITFGALIGKVTPLQLIIITIVELILWPLNYKILMDGVMEIQDIGGTYADHMFGAYFGLAVSWMLGKAERDPEMGTIPDIFSFLGALFLWIYWPSFVAGAATADSDEQGRAIVNTILALSGSTVASYWASSLLEAENKFRPVDIQNATLAGGVAIGAIANLNIGPFDAVITGVAAGIISTYGFNVIQPYLEINMGLHDSCGIHNLHAIPSVIGALASVVVQGYKSTQDGLEDQWWRQLAAMFLCIAFSIVTGLITGFFLRFLQVNEEEHDIKQFRDSAWWEVANDFGTSYYSELARGLKVEFESDFSSHNGRKTQKKNLDGSVAVEIEIP